MSRFGIDTGFFHRPLFAASIWAILTWRWQPAIQLGIFYELLWLDLFPAGTFIPPHALFAFVASLTILVSFDDPNMRLTTFVIGTSLPLAYFGAWIEQILRVRQNLNYTNLLNWSRRQSSTRPLQAPLVFRALIEHTIILWAAFTLCVAMLIPMARAAAPWLRDGSQPQWFMLWLGACIGAVLALRIRTAYATGIVSLILVILAS